MSSALLLFLPFCAIATQSPLSVLDFSYDQPAIGASHSDTYASLQLETALPSSFTICTSFMIKAWTNGADTSVYLFKLTGQGGDELISLILNVDQESIFKFEIQKEIFTALLTFPWIFPLDWVNICLAIEQSSGRINLVVDGNLLENRTFENIKISSISSLKIGEKCSAKWASFDIFLVALSLEKMKNMTRKGNSSCGKIGDVGILKNTGKWILSGNGGNVTDLEFTERPCRRVSEMLIYHMEAVHTQADCMDHCQKLWGRSPSVRTEKGWEKIMKQVIAIAGNESNVKNLPNIRLAASVGDGEPLSIPHICQGRQGRCS